MLRNILLLSIISLGAIGADLQAWRGGVVVEGGHHWHDRVYYGDPWYHPEHVYIYNGDPYANCYDGYPYYYHDPRFYYYH